MTSALDQAERLLDGSVSVGVNSVRAAAWVARSALEDALAALLRAKGCDPGRAGTRSWLTCIDVLYAGEARQVAQQCEYAWRGLSRACHHHAYELPPTHADVTSLVAIVRQLNEAAGGALSTRP